MKNCRYEKIIRAIIRLRKENEGGVIDTDQIEDKLEKEKFLIPRQDLNYILYDLESFTCIEYTTRSGYVINKESCEKHGFLKIKEAKCSGTKKTF